MAYRDVRLEISELPEHLLTEDNKNWLVSFQVAGIRDDGNAVILKTWRKIFGEVIREATLEMELDETITFVDRAA